MIICCSILYPVIGRVFTRSFSSMLDMRKYIHKRVVALKKQNISSRVVFHDFVLEDGIKAKSAVLIIY